MKNITLLVQFKLNNENLLEDWKKMSTIIDNDLKEVDGFLSRNSGIDEEGTVYCIVKWQSIEAQKAFRENFEKDEKSKQAMEEFARIVNMETMSRKTVDLF